MCKDKNNSPQCRGRRRMTVSKPVLGGVDQKELKKKW
jgi:hypothetical protein